MLVLSRKIGERILVPHCELTVTVVAVEGNRVRLGIAAPAEIAVYREEAWQPKGPQTQSIPEGSGRRVTIGVRI